MSPASRSCPVRFPGRRRAAQRTAHPRTHRGGPRVRTAADVVLFPELALSGYPPEDLLYRPGFLAECQAAIRRIAAPVRGIVAVVGWPESAGAVVYNAASVLRDGDIERTYRKRELPNYAVFDERRYFEVDPDGEVLRRRRQRREGRARHLRRPLVLRAARCVRARRRRTACWCPTPRRSSATSTRSAMRCSLRARPNRKCARLPQRRRRTGRARVRRCLGTGRRRRPRARGRACVRRPLAGRRLRHRDAALDAARLACRGRMRAATRWPGARSCAARATIAARTDSTRSG